MNIKDFQVGQKVVVVSDERPYSHSYHDEIVVAIGRKYVKTARPSEVERNVEVRYLFTTDYFVRNERDGYLVENTLAGNANILLPSRDAYLEYREHKELMRWLRDEVNYRNREFTLAQLRAIKQILESSTTSG